MNQMKGKCDAKRHYQYDCSLALVKNFPVNHEDQRGILIWRIAILHKKLLGFYIQKVHNLSKI